MKALITGAAGFIGSHTLEHFVSNGWEVCATDLGSADLTRAKQAGAEVVTSDVSDPSTLAPLMADVDAVIHTAGIFNFGVPSEVLHRVNVDGTTNTARAAANAGVPRFVAFSSVAVYGQPATVPCPEGAPKRPRNAYERSKWEGELAAFAFDGVGGMRVAALRPALVYGPRSRYGHAIMLGLMSMLRARGRSSTFALAGGPTTHQVHVADVAEAARVLATHPGAAGQSYNICDDSPVTLEQLMEIMAHESGLEVNERKRYSRATLRTLSWLVKHTPNALIAREQARTRALWRRVVERENLEPALDVRLDADWADYLYCDTFYDNSRVKRLGMELTYPNLIQGLAQTAAWYREQRWLPAAA